MRSPSAVAPAVVRALTTDSRAQLAAVLLMALVLRVLFFVGFSLGDDLGYLGHVTVILDGGYPPLEPLNQYAYRPLLLYLFAAGVWLFGFTDLGVVVAVMVASIATIAIIYVFVRRLIDPGAAIWCAVLFACEPFDVVNSTTMTNDVILACLVFAGVAVFLIADAEPVPARMRRLFAAAGVIFTSAFLVKMTLVPALCALGLYSAASLRTRAARVLRGHVVFYAAFLIGLACICAWYYARTGDPLWQFRSEFHYYETYKPDWYLRGDINYANLMREYPQSLFGFSGYGSFTYLEHGLLFWLFVPAAVWALASRQRGLSLFVLLTLAIFLFFQFYPQYWTPRYLPLVRQTRYLEQLLPMVVIVVGTALHHLWQRQRALAALLVIVVLADFVYEASRRSFMYNDSQQDMRALGEYVASTISHTRKALAVDIPARGSLEFYLRGSSVPLASIERQPSADSYVAVGGARSFWWSRDLVYDVDAGAVPSHWVLAYEVPGRSEPWRPSNLRVYYVGALPRDAHPFVAPLSSETASACAQQGLLEVRYTAGFDSPQASATTVAIVPEIDNGTSAAAHMEWRAAFRAEDDIYTFETMSDDGSWIDLNDELVLDNGGTHPTRKGSKTVRLGRGWYAFRLRYENAGGDQFLRFRVYRGVPATTSAPLNFCVEQSAGQGAVGSAPIR